METIASDPEVPGAIWRLTADLSAQYPRRTGDVHLEIEHGASHGARRAIHPILRRDIAEGLRNGLAISPGGIESVLTTQEGALRRPQPDISVPVVKCIPGPHISAPRPLLSISKNPHIRLEQAFLNQCRWNTSHHRLRILQPQPSALHLPQRRRWPSMEDGPLLHFPTDLDIFSMQFDNPRKRRPDYLYVGNGDQRSGCTSVRKMDTHSRSRRNSSIHTMAP